MIPDSPTWLLKHGKINEAKHYLFDAIHVNGQSSQLDNDLDILLENQIGAYAKEIKHQNWWSLWCNRKETILLIALHTAWAVDVTNYNGMLLNIRVFGREYLTINTIICGFCEIIGVLIAWGIIMKQNKRKFLCSGLFNVMAGLLSFIGFALPNNSK